MRIAVFFHGLTGGAFTNLGTTLVREFASQGICAEAVVLQATAEEMGRYRGMKVWSLGARRGITAIPALVRYLRSRRPTVFLSMPAEKNILALLARMLSSTKTRVVISEHALLSQDLRRERGINFRARLVPLLARSLYRFADGAVAVNEAIFSDPSIGPALLQVKGPREVIWNPLPHDIERLFAEPTGHPWLTRVRDRPVLVAVGRLARQKGFDVLIRSVALLRDRGVETRLIILGRGPEERDIEHQIHTLGLGNAIELRGFVRNPYSYMASADVFVLSSRWEPFGLVVIEAMACGSAIVSTAASGPLMILRQNETGLLVRPDDPQALADAIERVLREPLLKESLSRSARRASAVYSAATIARRYLDLFHRVASPR